MQTEMKIRELNISTNWQGHLTGRIVVVGDDGTHISLPLNSNTCHSLISQIQDQIGTCAKKLINETGKALLASINPGGLIEHQEEPKKEDQDFPV